MSPVTTAERSPVVCLRLVTALNSHSKNTALPTLSTARQKVYSP